MVTSEANASQPAAVQPPVERLLPKPVAGEEQLRGAGVIDGEGEHAVRPVQAGRAVRSVGMRLTTVGTTHLQARDLDQGLELGNGSVDTLACVQSTRAKDYVREFNIALAP